MEPTKKPLLSRLLEGAAVAILAIMFSMVFINVVLRYAFNTSIVSSEELARYFFVWLVFLAAILCYQEHSHICVDFVVKKFNAQSRRLCSVLVDLVVLVTSSLITLGSYRLSVIGAVEASPVTEIPMTVVYLPGVIGGGAILLLCLTHLVRVLTGKEGV
ncbi:MAG: TRAP transporter small permease [Succinivibrio sp.]|nr:TRAP transporter small permease [Succinivibrio sp.]